MKRKEEQCPKLERGGAVTSSERRGWELAKGRGDYGYEHLHLALTLEERKGRREVLCATEREWKEEGRSQREKR